MCHCMMEGCNLPLILQGSYSEETAWSLKRIQPFKQCWSWKAMETLEVELNAFCSYGTRELNVVVWMRMHVQLSHFSSRSLVVWLCLGRLRKYTHWGELWGFTASHHSHLLSVLAAMSACCHAHYDGDELLSLWNHKLVCKLPWS